MGLAKAKSKKSNHTSDCDQIRSNETRKHMRLNERHNLLKINCFDVSSMIGVELLEGLNSNFKMEFMQQLRKFQIIDRPRFVASKMHFDEFRILQIEFDIFHQRRVLDDPRKFIQRNRFRSVRIKHLESSEIQSVWTAQNGFKSCEFLLKKKKLIISTEFLKKTKKIEAN